MTMGFLSGWKSLSTTVGSRIRTHYLPARQLTVSRFILIALPAYFSAIISGGLSHSGTLCQQGDIHIDRLIFLSSSVIYSEQSDRSLKLTLLKHSNIDRSFVSSQWYTCSRGAILLWGQSPERVSVARLDSWVPPPGELKLVRVQ